MVRLREINRTAAFAWSPNAQAPLLATGTKAGAIDADFTNDTTLEVWNLDLSDVNAQADLQPVASLNTDSRFYDIAWGQPSADRPNGIIAGALENGSLDLWDAQKLGTDTSNAHISRTTSHSAAVKALQFNPFRPELLATAGNKGELYIQDINSGGYPFRLGTATARADNFDCLDWNKKVAHILVTGSSGGFATVWDVKQRKESLTLNNAGRKSISAIAWDPTIPTKLATATSNDQDPVILLWDLRNSNAPEKTLRLHDQGVLSISWCQQDPRLLLSCGKDNRTICWNTGNGDLLGEFPIVTNWTFQTRWNPYSPGLLATASFDGKISIHNTQSTNSSVKEDTSRLSLDGADFFASVPSVPQGVAFSLPLAPKWLERPVSATFGFGGKLIKVAATGRSSVVSIDTYIADPLIGEASEKFEQVVAGGNFTEFCDGKISEATSEEEKADWTVIETLISGSRSNLVGYLGISPSETAAVADSEEKTNGVAPAADDSSFFDGAEDNFLSQLASTKGVKTNNPFQIYTGRESEADQRITQALMLGSFDKALDICLKEDRMSDAFMIAICGGQQCIEKAQAAYFKRKGDGPNYLRLIASVVGKNLWDVVYNADLANWKEVMATLCTFADETEFPDLCEALGDRLEEQASGSVSARKDASFCYLAGSKLEKVVQIWTQELVEKEKAQLQASDAESGYTVHAKALQDFIEKVTVFRNVTKYQDPEIAKTSDWKMDPLYKKYSEYAGILTSQGKLQVAGKYLNLLPQQYPDAQASRDRVALATKTPAVTQRQTGGLPAQQQRAQRVVPTFSAQPAPVAAAIPAASPYAPAGFQPAPVQPQQPSAYAPPATGNSYTPAGFGAQQPAATPFQQQGYGAPAAQPFNAGYQQFGTVAPPPMRGSTDSPGPPPAASQKTVNQWNDTPDFGPAKPARRATPVVSAPVQSPYAPAGGAAQPNGNAFAPPPRTSSAVPPPPKAGAPRVASPAPAAAPAQEQRPTSSAAASQYSPAVPAANTLPQPAQPPMARGPSPFSPPPAAAPAAAPANNRYAPAPGSVPAAQNFYAGGAPGGPPGGRQIAPPPTAASYAPAGPNAYGQQQSAPPAAPMMAPAPPPKAAPPPVAQAPPAPPPKAAPPPRAGPPPASQTPRSRPLPVASQAELPPPERPASAAPPAEAAPPREKYPAGDRSHISPSAMPIVEILSAEIARVKAKAPPTYRPHVLDTEKRLNILFDHLNNDDLLKPDTVQEMVDLSNQIQAKQYEEAQQAFMELMTRKNDEGSNWMVGLKRLIQMGKATP